MNTFLLFLITGILVAIVLYIIEVKNPVDKEILDGESQTNFSGPGNPYYDDDPG